MTRTLLIATCALVLPASSAIAQLVPAGSGALAGRSPQVSYRTADATAATCGKTMHSLPAGKLPVYGANALPKAPCSSVELARADTADAAKSTARD
ncbi:hypothetical protein ACSBM8_14135 [Sphingomonas sp. ASY06-1R]|uniref:hypothetical protein n=1 Tax=Sphingomonas sp. ASY06-1R TaxID=3445771 RepID=UPI003FA27EC6